MTQDQTKHLSLKAAYKFAIERGFADEATVIRNMAIDGFENARSSVRRGYIVKLLEDNRLFGEFKERFWANGNTRDGEAQYRRYRLLHEQHERFQEGDGGEETGDEGNGDGEGQGFALEADLRDYLANNLEVIEPGLQLYRQEDRSGIEFSVTNGYIDILATDRSGGFVVIELKLSRGRNRTVGQILYYMGWVDEHLQAKAPCRGMIIARDIGTDLLVATRRTSGITLFQYAVSMTVTQVFSSGGDA